MKGIAVDEAVAMIPNGATLMIGGFMAVGTPERLMDELVKQDRKGLTVIANDSARPGVGIGKLIDHKAVAKLMVSHIGTNPETQRQMIAGETVPDIWWRYRLAPGVSVDEVVRNTEAELIIPAKVPEMPIVT